MRRFWLIFAVVLLISAALESYGKYEAKLQTHVSGTEEDELLARLVRDAREGLEHMLQRALITQTIECGFQRFGPYLPLALGPVQSITSIEYLDSSDNLQTLDPAGVGAAGRGVLLLGPTGDPCAEALAQLGLDLARCVVIRGDVVDAGRALQELAAAHERTMGAVRARLLKYGRINA